MSMFRKFKRIVAPRLAAPILGLFTLGLVSCALAQPAEPPKNSVLALRVNPWPATASSVDRQALRQHPLFRLVGRLGKHALGFEPLKFVDDTFEGTFIAAVVNPGDQKTVHLAEFFQDMEARKDWDHTVRELRSLKSDLVGQYGNNDEPYPDNLETYLAEVRYYEPSLPAGVSYRYTVTDGGRNFQIQAVFESWSDLNRLGRPPLFDSNGEDENLAPTAPLVPLNLVLGAKIRDRHQLTALLNKAFGPSKNGFWRSDVDNKVGLLVTIRDNWVVAADQMSNMGDFLKAAEGKAPGWSKNPAFQTVARNLEADAPLLMFVDAAKIVSAFQPDATGPEATLAKLVGPWGYSISPYTQSQVRFDLFMGVNAPAGSKLQQYMKDSALMVGGQAEVDNIPWDVSNVYGLEYTNVKGLLDAVVALFPEAVDGYSSGQDVFAGMLGLDAEAGFDRLLSGPAIVSFEEIDTLIAGVDSFLYGVRQGMTDITPPQPEKAPDSDPEMDTQEGSDNKPEVVTEVPKRPGPFTFLPLTFAVNVPSYLNRTAIVNMLQPYMGEEKTTENLYGVDIITSTDGTLSYALDGDWVYLSGGRSERLMKHMLEAAHGRKQTLASIDSFSRFQLQSKGRLLAFGHQKVDAFYSLMKGFVLFLGVEFRPLAQELGKLRDYHSVLTLVPDGVNLSGEIVQGDDR